MFDPDEPGRPSRPETEALFKKVLEAWDARNPQIGDIIPVRWLYEQLGVVHPSQINEPSWQQFQQAQFQFMTLFHGEYGFRAYLLIQRKRHLKSNHSEGYEVLDPEKQTAFAQQQRRHAINKALKDEIFILSHVDANRLSAKQRQENADAISHNYAINKILHRRRAGFGNDNKSGKPKRK